MSWQVDHHFVSDFFAANFSENSISPRKRGFFRTPIDNDLCGDIVVSVDQKCPKRFFDAPFFNIRNYI